LRRTGVACTLTIFISISLAYRIDRTLVHDSGNHRQTGL
jgi:hypothetical protein